MSLVNSPGIVTNGLVMHYDMSNQKSYTGPAMSNLPTSITPNASDNGSTYRFFAGTDTDYIPTLGTTTYSYVDMYNDYNGGSGNCCPNPFSYGSFAVTGNTVYTYGIVYRSANRYTHPNMMYHYEYNSGWSYLTEFGVHNNGYSWQETHLGNGWYWSRAKFTSHASAAYFVTYSFMYQYATWNRWEVAKVLVSAGDWTNTHPKYWPAVNSSRAASGVVSDLTNRNTLSSSLTYNSDGTFSFNGADGYVNLGASNTYLPMPQFTLESWHKCPGLGSGMYTSSPWGITYGITGNLYSDGSAAYNVYNSDTSTTYSYVGTSGVNLVDNNWHHVVYVVGTPNSYIYVDGVLNATGVNNGTWSGTNVWSAMAAVVGNNPNNYYYHFNGQIPVARIYNRALTAEEVKQNFNAQRGRYGV